MMKTNDNYSRFLSHVRKILFLALATLVMTIPAQAAAPVGQTIWLRATANSQFVSADQNSWNVGTAGCRPLIS